MNFVFVTRCVEANGDDINEMRDSPASRDLSRGYFIEHVGNKHGIGKDVLSMLGYDTKKFFKNDWSVSCAASFYQGIPCYYVVHSAIEYVFVSTENLSKVLSAEEARIRQGVISSLSDDLDEMIEERNPVSTRDYNLLARDFYRANKEQLEKYRIPLSSFAQYRCNHSNAFLAFDKKHYGKKNDDGISCEM